MYELIFHLPSFFQFFFFLSFFSIHRERTVKLISFTKIPLLSDTLEKEEKKKCIDNSQCVFYRAPSLSYLAIKSGQQERRRGGQRSQRCAEVSRVIEFSNLLLQILSNLSPSLSLLPDLPFANPDNMRAGNPEGGRLRLLF